MSFDLKLVNGNLQIGSDGDLSKVTNTDKLKQDILKFLITPLGANKMHLWYGSPFGKTIIGTPFDLDFAKARGSQQIISGIEMIKTLQTSQTEYQGVTASEAIAQVLGVSISTDNNDRRLIKVFVSVLNKAAVKSSVGFNVAI